MNLCAKLDTVKMSLATDTYHHGNLRQALIDAAAGVLEDEGADAVTFRGLARALGVSHAAPGHHFTDRAGLLAELAADGYRGLADAMAVSDGGCRARGLAASDRDRLRAVCRCQPGAVSHDVRVATRR